MGFPAQIDRGERIHPHDDTVAHYWFHEGRIVLQAVVVLSIVATAVTAITFWFWAFIPATILLASYLLLIVSNHLEGRTQHRELMQRDTDDTAPAEAPGAGSAEEISAWDVRDVSIPFLKREGWIGLEIAVGAGLAALVLAIVLLPWKLTLIGALLFFFYMLLVMGPVWLGWFTEEVDHETDRLRAEQRPKA
jgi:hypothetical protein